ncbi:MAG: TadE/TadG family type IV pilus assembly protein [Xanthobacteraceae bacterium]
MTTRSKSLRTSERGSALIEASIVLPLLLALVGGVLEFSFFFYQEQLITVGVRDAARYLALTADPTSATNQVGAMNLAVAGSIDGGTPRVPGWNIADVSVSITPWDNSDGALSGRTMIPIITVSTHFAESSLGFLRLLGLSAPTISVSHQERWVGGSASLGGVQ